MTIDSISSQASKVSTLATQQASEIVADRENDGDSDDTSQSVSKATAMQQIVPQGVGTKVDIFA
jgi:hypothetical protein